MSKFLKSLVRSEQKSCAGKIKFPREDSARRAAAEMMQKKGNGEVFEYYRCGFCKTNNDGDVWHIGHQTNFDWIPESHNAYTLMINQHICFGACNGKGTMFLTHTVVSNRIIARFPGIATVPEIGAVCPVCRSTTVQECRRLFVPLSEIDQDSTEPVESIWQRYHTS